MVISDSFQGGALEFMDQASGLLSQNQALAEPLLSCVHQEFNISEAQSIFCWNEGWRPDSEGDDFMLHCCFWGEISCQGTMEEEGSKFQAESCELTFTFQFIFGMFVYPSVKEAGRFSGGAWWNGVLRPLHGNGGATLSTRPPSLIQSWPWTYEVWFMGPDEA